MKKKIILPTPSQILGSVCWKFHPLFIYTFTQLWLGSIWLTHRLSYLCLRVSLSHPYTFSHAPPQQECDALIKFITSHQQGTSFPEVNQTPRVSRGHKLPSSKPSWPARLHICSIRKSVLIQQRSLLSKEWRSPVHGGMFLTPLIKIHPMSLLCLTCWWVWGVYTKKVWRHLSNTHKCISLHWRIIY